MDISQTSKQPVVRTSWCRHHLKHRLESPVVKFLLYLVSVEVCGNQAEKVHIHLLQFAHPADDVWEAGRRVKGNNSKGRKTASPRGSLPKSTNRPREDSRQPKQRVA